MKKLFLLFFLCFASTLSAFSQSVADAIVGTYVTEKGNAKVTISREGDKYIGVIAWTKTLGKLDSENPKASERSKKLVGKRILENFVYTEKDTWEKGSIYDPESGKTYSCKITRQRDGSLKVRGFIGISLIGRTTTWRRV